MNTLIKIIVIASVTLFAITSHATSNSSTTSDQATWDGTTPVLFEVCAFTNTTNGTMVYVDSTRTWTTTSPAKFDIEIRDVKNVEVTTDGKVFRDNGNKFTGNSDVDYTGSTNSGISGTTAEFDLNEYTVGDIDDKSGELEILVGGKAVMTDGFLDLKSQTDYFIEHTATCIQ